MTAEKRDYIAEGQRAYQEWRDSFVANPENRRLYEEEAVEAAFTHCEAKLVTKHAKSPRKAA